MAIQKFANYQAIDDVNQALLNLRAKHSVDELYQAMLIVAVAWGRRARADEQVIADLTSTARAVASEITEPN